MRYFSTADTMHGYNTGIRVPPIIREEIADIISYFERGMITLIEGRDLNNVHRGLHELFIELQGNSSIERTTFVDMGNTFNPHVFTDIYPGVNAYAVMNQIDLARPFQLYQCVSMIRRLQRRLQQTEEKHLIVVSNLTAQFFADSPSRTGESIGSLINYLRFILGILQQMAVQGHVVIVTDTLTNRKRYEKETSMQVKLLRLFSTMAKVHIKVEQNEHHRTVRLLNHPLLPPRSKSMELARRKSRKPSPPAESISLDVWF